ncbi:MAG: hypothetical protein AUJ20_02640 [Comamonadaceae bacterium CG1_02_60_18]|nr:MAG: hypothetical protein AUJ20_02640 [Comamonadaceae bacterium CG1_02_60_18]PIQ51487.1 MAG: hypothetical protein COW02_14465 [Comamonadaceae bacterium CG12_big_fil_rev_8_21_14_0_65_59_15]
MSQIKHIFADRLTNITVTGNLIRLAMGTLQPPTEQGQKPQLMLSQTLVMPIEGFLPSFGMMQAELKQLVDAGVLTLQLPAQQDEASTVQ